MSLSTCSFFYTIFKKPVFNLPIARITCFNLICGGTVYLWVFVTFVVFLYVVELGNNLLILIILVFLDCLLLKKYKQIT